MFNKVNNLGHVYRNILMFIRVCVISSSLPLVVACDSLSVYGGKLSASSEYSGLRDVELTDEGKLLLSWTAPNDEAEHTYRINYLKVPQLPASLADTSFTERPPLSLTAVDLDKEYDSLSLEELSKVKNESSYTFDQAIEMDSYYIFQVTMPNSKVSRRRLFIVKVDLAPPKGVQAIPSEAGMNLVWDRAAGATSYAISGLSEPKVSTRETTFAINSYDARADYSLCISAQHGNLSSQTCTSVALPANLSKTRAISVTSSIADGFYASGAVIPIDVKFSNIVSLAATSSLRLQIKHGMTETFVPYTSGSGTDTLSFNYTVQSGQDSVAIDALSLLPRDNAKSLLDDKGRLVLYNLPPSNSGKTLAEQKQIQIDTIAPAPPSAIIFSSPVSATLAFGVSWTAGSDANLSGYSSKICADPACSMSCSTESTVSLDLTTTKTGVDGNSYYACVKAIDKAGNLSTWASSATPVTIETSAPVVISVTSAMTNGIFKAASIIPIQVVYSSNVYVTNGNDFTLSLETGTTDTNAVYSSGTGTNTLIFNYTVQPGDNASDLNYVSTGSLGLGALGALKAASGVGVSLTLPGLSSAGALGVLKDFKIDTTTPAPPSSVGFAAPLSTSTNIVMSWADSIDTPNNFRYHNVKICAANDCSTSCTSVATDLASPAMMAGVNGATYYGCVQGEDLAGNKTAWVPSVGTVKVDTALPTVTNISSTAADGYYKANAPLSIDLNFSENVFVTSGSDLALAMSSGSSAVFTTGSGTSKLNFTYTVHAGDNSADLDVASAAALTLIGSGAIKDAAGNNATLNLPTTDLSVSKAIVIDTTLPVAPNSVGFASTKSSALSFPTNWTNSTDTNFKQHNIMLCAASNCTTSCSSNVIQWASPASVTGVNAGVYYSCVQGEDLAGNVSAWVPSGSPLTVDTTGPIVTDVSSTTADGIYRAGDAIILTVQFSKSVYVLGSESLGLLLETGTTDRTATYLAGSGSSTLTFKYVVQVGDISADLDAQSTAALTVGAGSIKDDASNAAVLTLPALAGVNSIAGHKAILIDTMNPSAPASIGFAGASSTSLTFNMSWANGTDTNFSIHNTKLCAASDCSSSCISAGTSAASPKSMTGVHGGVYYGCVQAQDTVGNTSAWVASVSTITVDSTVPTVTNITSPAPDAYYKAGATIPITVAFSEKVYVGNSTSLRLILETGATDTEATYASGTGSNTLVFNYLVAATDTSTDLDAASTSALILGGGGGIIQDAGGNNATLTLPTGVNSIAGQKALVIDTTLPSVPSDVSFPDSYSLSTAFLVSWTSGTDANFRTSDLKLCLNSGCSTSCVSPNTSAASPASVTGVVGTTYYGCVQSRDLADNVSGYVASASTITVEALPTFAGVASGEVLGSWADGTGKLELTFAGTPAPTIQKYQIFYSASSNYASFDISSPIATINYGDATYDATPTDTKLLISIPAASLKDGYYYVRYYDVNGKYVDPNRSISSVVYVLKGARGYVLVPKKFSSLSYDYYIMRYEASLSSSGTNAGGDTVTTTESSLAGCAYKFHIDGLAADASCGSKVITKAAESVSGVTPQASISWPSAFYACRNASGSNAKIRLPTADEWRRASQWIGTSYSSMWTTYSNNSGGNCNVTAGSEGSTGSATLCKSALGAQDMAGNLREWVDNRMLQYSISGNTETRFSYGPTIGRTIPNGIDNIVRRFHTLDPGPGGLAMTLGANFETPSFADQKQYGTDVQTWTDPSTTSLDIGFRCLGFRADAMPTLSQLAMPDEPKFTAAEVSAVPSIVPENFYAKDNKWEIVAITIDGTTTDAVAEGRVNVTWQPWSKTTCDTSGTCTASDAGLIYKLYRFIEPNHQSIRTAVPWALGNSGSNYASDKPLDPLAVDSSGNRLFSASSSDGTLIGTVSNCISATPGNCTFADLSTKDGGSLVVGKIYDYILVVEDALGNAVTPMVQRYRSPYFAGPALASASAFRMEPRYRRASVFLVDEYHQQNQTRPQIMVHVPMEKSGLDHDFFIQKYEASQFGATAPVNNSPAGAYAWPTQGTAAAWVKNAALCNDVFLQTGIFDPTGCGDGTLINASNATVQSKQGTAPLLSIDQGAAWKACRNTTLADSDGKNYSLQLTGVSEWLKAADWGDTNQDGTIEATVNTFTGGVSITSLESGTADSTTIRCHTDNSPASALTSNSSGPGSSSNCRSRYGAADMQGNAWEWTGGQISTAAGQDNGFDGLWLGQSFLTGSNVTFASLGSGNYDLLRGLPKGTGAAPIVADTGDYYFYNSGLRGSLRGGYWNSNSRAGRWYMDVNNPPSNALTSVSLRCFF